MRYPLTTHFQVSGRVADKNNAPVNDVAISLFLNGAYYDVTMTYGNGDYSFTNVPAGSKYALVPSKAGYNFTPPAPEFSNPSGNQTVNFVAALIPSPNPSPTPVPTPTPPVGGSAVQFSAANYSVNEGVGAATITVSRSGDLSAVSTVDYATSDGTALQRTRYTTATGTLSFAAGETQKSFTVLVIDNTRVDGNQTINLSLSNAVGAQLGSQKTAVLTVQDNDTSAPTTNPIDSVAMFVRQQYLDFLNRAPDDGGFAFWSSLITACSPTDQVCINSRRVSVSAAFFIEQEFQLTGNYVYRMYTAAYGQRPTYAQFMPDRARINPNASQIEASKQQFADLFVQRPEFLAKYPATMAPDAFINGLIATVKTETNGVVDLTSQHATLLSTLQTSGRGSAVRQVAETTAFQSAEYNKAFVTMQYFGYLRRDPEDGGFNFWLDVLNNKVANNYRGMVCAFITSAEYQDRFSSVIYSGRQNLDSETRRDRVG